MLKKIRSTFKENDKKQLVRNFFSLSMLQMMNYALPLIVVPYLFTTLGTEKYGLVVFAQAIVIYFGLFISYGFSLSATKEISVHREDSVKVSKIYSTVTTVKLLLVMCALCVFIPMVYYIEKFQKEWIIYAFSFGIVIESILFPTWFFQGMERMKYITIIYFISKIVVTVLIFITIKKADDYVLVPALYLAGSVAAGIVSQLILIKKFKVKFIAPSLREIIYQLKDGWHLFVSMLGINMYRNANVLILGFITTTLFVGYYALAEKVIKALQSIMVPISETLYPYFANKSSNQSEQQSIKDIFKIAIYYSLILIVIVSCVFIFSPYIVKILSGENLENVILDMRILCIVIFFGGLNYLFGIIGLVNIGHKKYFTKSVLIAGFINVVLCFYTGFFMYDIGASISLATSELVLTLLLVRKMLIVREGVK